MAKVALKGREVQGPDNRSKDLSIQTLHPYFDLPESRTGQERYLIRGEGIGPDLSEKFDRAAAVQPPERFEDCPEGRMGV